MLKKRDQTEKNGTKKQKTAASPRVEPGLSERSNNYFSTARTTVTHMILKMNFVISKQFFPTIDAV